MIEAAVDPGAAGGRIADPQFALDDLFEARILVVDDNRVGSALIEGILRRAGFTDLKTAADGAAGLKAIFEWKPEIVITDLMMPVMDGFDLCRWVRAEPRFSDIPIVVQTAIDDTDVRGTVFSAGATDLVLKPIHATELISRVRIHLERRRLIQRLQEYKRRTADELEAARAMQASLMPTRAGVAAIEGSLPAEIASCSIASSGLAGDLWGLDRLGSHRLRVWSADFTGHGVYSALNTFRLHTFLRTGPGGDLGPVDWLAGVNDFLCDVLPLGQFATMLCAEIDFEGGSIALASAAAPPPIVSNGQRCGALELEGLPLGITRRAEFDAIELPFLKGSVLFAYSDALTETPQPDQPLIPVWEVSRQVCDHGGGDLSSLLAGFLRRLRASARDGLADDLTMIGIRHREAEQ